MLQTQSNHNDNDYPYEFADDSNLKLRSEMLTHLLIGLNLEDNLKIITDMAFEVMDEDNSGGLDTIELKNVMDRVAD